METPAEKWINQYRDIFGVCGAQAKEMLQSCICRPAEAERLAKIWEFAELSKHLVRDSVMDRKMWEWMYIAQALDERGMLQEDRRGLGFACGTEPLVSVFASKGAAVTASDAPVEISATDIWHNTNQYSKEKNSLYYSELCDEETFNDKVSFCNIDMNRIPQDYTGFDFLWSSCALEHLGSLHAAKEFIYRSMDCLKPGGVAVHTTEINIKSSIETQTMGFTSALRTIDLIEIAEHLEWQGHRVEPLDFRLDGSKQDAHYVTLGENHHIPHFKLKQNRVLLTSFGLIVYKPA